MASGSVDNTAKVWNVEGKLLHTVKINSSVYSVDFGPGGKTLATSNGNIASLWSLEKERHPILGERERQQFISSVKASPNDRYIVVGSYQENSKPKLWELEQNTLKTRSSPKALNHDSVFSVDLNSDLNIIATGSQYGNVKIWNLEGQEIAAKATNLSLNPSTRFLPGNH